MSRGRERARRALAAIAGVGGGGKRPMADLAGVVLGSGRGSFVYDSAGKPYLDAVAGYGVASIGHSHPAWVDAVVEQAQRLAGTPLYTEELGLYLEALADLLPPSLGQVALFSTGAEAVETAVRLAQTASGKPEVLTFRDGFHGKTAAIRYTRRPETPEARIIAPSWMRSAEYPVCHHDPVDYPDCEDVGTDLLRAIASRTDLDEVGSILVEPVLGTAGNIPPKRGFLRGLRQLCQERNWLLVYDESITGLGRTGRMFAFEYFDARPDVMVLSKGLGGGLPFSAVCAAKETWDASALASPSSTSSTFGGNPLACAAGLATLRILTSAGFLEGVRESAQRLATGLRELSGASEAVAWPRGVGMMLGFDHLDPATDSFAGETLCADRFQACRDRGLLIAAHSPRVRINPPLILTLGEADQLVETLFEVFV